MSKTNYKEEQTKLTFNVYRDNSTIKHIKILHDDFAKVINDSTLLILFEVSLTNNQVRYDITAYSSLAKGELGKRYSSHEQKVLHSFDDANEAIEKYNQLVTKG